MSSFEASVEVEATPERAFEVFTDASRYPQWQALAQRAFDLRGSLLEPGSTVRIDHGPGMKRTLTVLDVDPPHRWVYRQQGMGLDDTNEVRFEPGGQGTIVSMRSELRVAGGAIGRLLDRLGRGQNQREFQAELDRFAGLLARPRIAVPPTGSVVTGDSGKGIRTMKVLAADDQVVHLAVLPGADRDRDIDLDAALDRDGGRPDPHPVEPLQATTRKLTGRIVPGSPFLRVDGGLGVPHLPVTIDAYTDMEPVPTGRSTEVWDEELTEIAGWADAGAPTAGGRDVIELRPLVIVREEGSYAPAKVLARDRKGVHLRLYSDRWAAPPDRLDPWALRMERFDARVPGVGHIPMTVNAYVAMEPTFERLALTVSREFDGLRTWEEAQGGYFA